MAADESAHTCSLIYANGQLTFWMYYQTVGRRQCHILLFLNHLRSLMVSQCSDLLPREVSVEETKRKHHNFRSLPNPGGGLSLVSMSRSRHARNVIGSPAPAALCPPGFLLRTASLLGFFPSSGGHLCSRKDNVVQIRKEAGLDGVTCAALVRWWWWWCCC